MTLKSYIWGMRLVVLFSAIAWALVFNFVDPEKSGAAGKLLFYVVLFFILGGLFNLFLLWIRKKTLGVDGAALNVVLSFRQGMLLSIFVIGLLLLQSFRVLIWWDGMLLFAGIFLVELYFLSKG